MSANDHDARDRCEAVQAAPAVTILTAEALRGAAASARLPEAPPARGEERIALFWRVFGGTLLSIAALVMVTLYQQFTGSINELRGEITKLNEARADLVKKDEFNARLTPMWNGVKEAQANGAGVAGAREKLAQQDVQIKQDEQERKDLAREVQLLRERVAKLEGRQGTKTIPTGVPDIPD